LFAALYFSTSFFQRHSRHSSLLTIPPLDYFMTFSALTFLTFLTFTRSTAPHLTNTCAQSRYDSLSAFLTAFVNAVVLAFSTVAFSILALMLASVPVLAQSGGRSSGGELSPLEVPSFGGAQLGNQSGSALGLNGSSSPTDNVVSAAHYLLGPGDVLLMQIVGAVMGEYPLVVSPENVIMLPRFGEVSVQGKTLAQVKAEVQRLVQARNPLMKAFLTLQRARTVYVRVAGNVAQPGLYTLPASMKVSTAVQLANQPASGSGGGVGGAAAGSNAVNAALARQQSNRFEASGTSSDALASALGGKRHYIASYASRATRVLHRNGSVEYSDALRANVLDDPSADPTVREGDEIYVPADNEAIGMISITGAVQRPSVIPWRKGDKLSFLLKAAFGLTETADSASVLVALGGVSAGANSSVASVASSSSADSSATGLHAAEILRGTADRLLSAGTTVNVRELATQSAKQETVVLVGEVRNPGVYVLDGAGGANGGTDNKRRLRAIIAAAGGLTSDAHLPASYITRRDMMGFAGQAFGASAASTQSEAYRMAQYTTLGAEDTTRYNLDATLRRPTVACDFAAALAESAASTSPISPTSASANNVVLNDGDVVVVARNPRHVFVFGHVAKPGYVAFSGETSAEAFISLVGGYAAGADTSKTRIIRSGSNLWVEPYAANSDSRRTSVLVRSGDQVYVPRLADSTSDLGLRRAQLAVQKESNELQKRSLELQESNRVWTIVGTIAGLLATVLSLLLTFRIVTLP
jgi:protein involved in polysaccharide export with SLBB domain